MKTRRYKESLVASSDGITTIIMRNGGKEVFQHTILQQQGPTSTFFEKVSIDEHTTQQEEM